MADMPQQCLCVDPQVRPREHVCLRCGGVADGPAATVARLSSWRTPATDYPRERVGRAAIRTRRYSRGIYDCYMQHGHPYYVAEHRLTITTLTIDGETWMVDDPPHWWAMEEHARSYTGHVLCAGLGLGLMVHALNASSAVDQITVIEREQDVIDLVSPQIPHDKLTIACADFFEADPHEFPPVDGVLFDLFVGDGRELMGPAINIAVGILTRWSRAGDDDFVVRVHGLPNPMVGEVAQEIARSESSERIRTH